MTKSRVVAIAAASFLPLSVAYSEPCHINLNGVFQLYQTTTRTNVTVVLKQRGDSLSGTATGGGNGKVSGTLSGRLVGITITWPDGRPGIYNWTIGDSGELVNGNAHDGWDPQSATGLTSESNFCQ
jgi:hypothetical protein